MGSTFSSVDLQYYHMKSILAQAHRQLNRFGGRGVNRGVSRVGRRGLEPRSDFKLPNFLKLEIIGFCLTTSSHKSNFHANHANHTHNAQKLTCIAPVRFSPGSATGCKCRSTMMGQEILACAQLSAFTFI